MAATGRYDFAAFHLLTSMEEWVKAKLLYLAHHGLAKGLKLNGQPLLQNIDSFLFAHTPKLATGLLSLFIQGRITQLFTPDGTAVRRPPAVAEAVRKQHNEDVIWLLQVFASHPRLREEAIYSGPDKDGNSLPPIDWKRFTTSVTPMLEGLVPLQAATLRQSVSDADRTEFRAMWSELVRQAALA